MWLLLRSPWIGRFFESVDFFMEDSLEMTIYRDTGEQTVGRDFMVHVVVSLDRALQVGRFILGR